MTRLGIILSVLCGALAFAGCGSSSSTPGTGPGGTGAACTSTAECGGGVCVSIGAAATCSLKCSVSANECGAESSCQGVGSLSVNVCAPKPKASSGGSPKQEEQPKVPCKADSECNSLVAGAICATWKGIRDCALPCTSDAVCKTPSIGGISVDFERCQPDEGMTARKACLPRAECLMNPLACIMAPGVADGGFVVPGIDSGVPGPGPGELDGGDGL